jgi:predicted site-specific integrase-resolvase
MKVALYARVSTADQKSLKSQMEEMRNYAQGRKWEIMTKVKEIGSGGKVRLKREELMQMARRREIDWHHRLEARPLGTLHDRPFNPH